MLYTQHVSLQQWKLSGLSFALLCISFPAWAEVTMTAMPSAPSEPIPTLATLSFQAKATAKDPDISAVAKTTVTREEMLKYGDQSVNDTLRRAAGFQMSAAGQGVRGGGGASGMRFRGGGAPIFLVNGEPIQGGPRSGMSIVDTLTPDMIEKIEIIKQPSVAYGSVASSAVINIILKEPLKNAPLGGTARVAYAFSKSEKNDEDRKNLSLQMDGRQQSWLYSLSANQIWTDATRLTQTQTAHQIHEQKRVIQQHSTMFAPRVEYEIDNKQKVVGEVFYRKNERDGTRHDQIQNDHNESLRFNTRYERKDQANSDKVRFSLEKQDETEATRSLRENSYIHEKINEYGFAYDGIRKFDAKKQIKFGVDTRTSALKSNMVDTLDEQRFAFIQKAVGVLQANKP